MLRSRLSINCGCGLIPHSRYFSIAVLILQYRGKFYFGIFYLWTFYFGMSYFGYFIFGCLFWELVCGCGLIPQYRRFNIAANFILGVIGF